MMKRILITSISSDAGSSVLRALAAEGHEVMGAESQRLPFGIHSRRLSKVYELPSPTDTNFDSALIEVVNNAQPDVFLPLGTWNTLTTCRKASTLANITHFNVPDYEAFLAAFDHTVCNNELHDLEIPCPTTYTPEEAVKVLEDASGAATIVVKPRTDVGMAKGIRYVRDIEGLHRGVAECDLRFGGVTLQEFIPGDATAMRTVVILFDRHSELVAAFTTRKLRHYPPSGGLTALSVSTNEFNLVEQILPFFRKWQWRGAAEVELKFDSRDAQFKVIEINPRFPGYLRFPLVCGLPLARLAMALSLGDKTVHPLHFPSYRVGMKYVNPGLFLRSVLADFSSGLARSGALKRSILDLSGAAPMFADMLKDPLPMMGRLLLDVRNLSGYRTSLERI